MRPGGYRLGYGGGFYDRMLASLTPETLYGRSGLWHRICR